MVQRAFGRPGEHHPSLSIIDGPRRAHQSPKGGAIDGGYPSLDEPPATTYDHSSLLTPTWAGAAPPERSAALR
jgi:hypothetical protein